MNEITPEIIRSYLLGSLDEPNRARLEEKLLTVRSVYDELLIAEDELTDQYLADELSDSEREGFEKHFLSAPERQVKLRFARNLRRYVRLENEGEPQKEDDPSLALSSPNAQHRPKKRYFFSFLPIQNPVIGYSIAAVVVFAVLGLSWTVFNNLRSTQPRTGEVFAVTLTSGLVRDSGTMTSFNIPPGTDSVQLQLSLTSDDYQNYRAELLTGDRDSVHVEENLRPEGAGANKTVTLHVPADILKRGHYRVKLSGLRPDGNYEDVEGFVFRVM